MMGGLTEDSIESFTYSIFFYSSILYLQHLHDTITSYKQNELPHGKTNNLHVRKQRRRSASR